jgi:hypothetical protein
MLLIVKSFDVHQQGCYSKLKSYGLHNHTDGSSERLVEYPYGYIVTIFLALL